jgi:hypothetical protein
MNKVRRPASLLREPDRIFGSQVIFLARTVCRTGYEVTAERFFFVPTQQDSGKYEEDSGIHKYIAN